MSCLETGGLDIVRTALCFHLLRGGTSKTFAVLEGLQDFQRLDDQ